MKIWKTAVLFYIGGTAYMTLEFLWRGYSHGSMFIAGGACFLLIGHLNQVRPRLQLPLRAVVGAGIVTMVELGIGLLCNRDFQVWDYREQTGKLPLNFMGQICPLFTLLWIPVSLLALGLHTLLDHWMDRIFVTRCAYL